MPISYFVQFIVPHKIFVNIVENTVNELAALLGAVFLCQVYIFIDGYLGWNSFKKQELSYAHTHKKHIQHRNTVRVPVL
jgi:hypothetical protein